jgi:hypothetical protein
MIFPCPRLAWPIALTAFVCKMVFIAVHLFLAIFLHRSAKQVSVVHLYYCSIRHKSSSFRTLRHIKGGSKQFVLFLYSGMKID